LAISHSSSAVKNVTYGYDSSTGRLNAVADDAQSASYTYLPNSPEIETTTLKQGTNTRLVTTRVLDGLGRLSSLETKNAANQVLERNAYSYDSRGRRSVAIEE